MILSFSGDPFLATRAATRALRARGFGPDEVNALGEGMSADEVARLAAQSGLFGQAALLLDFDAAFKGQAGVKARNEVLGVLEQVPDETLVVVLDLEATPARQKSYREKGEHVHVPTPRFEALTHWIHQELEAEGVRFDAGVPEVLADIFGEDVPGIAAEIQKFTALDETLDVARVREVANRPAARDAFDLIDALAKGDAAMALGVCRTLLAQGEAPPRVLGALHWQFNLVARCVALAQDRARVDAGLVAQTLKVRPFVAKKALAIAKRLDEARLKRVLTALLEADIALKSGKDEAWTLEALAIRVAATFAGRAAA